MYANTPSTPAAAARAPARTVTDAPSELEAPNRRPRVTPTVTSNAIAPPPNRSVAATVCGTWSTTLFELANAPPHSIIVTVSSA
ncbi:hypothetical protein GCM10009839_37970 [Catenulispora yoronensis]|uniref:Uncharacterized protein n=1 Tax=Catenulispora yoronensis TaxID=450799 RepID=A0ABN2UB91_9ACTN